MLIKIRNETSNWPNFPDECPTVAHIKKFIEDNYKNYKGLKIDIEGYKVYIYFYLPASKDLNAYAVYWNVKSLDKST